MKIRFNVDPKTSTFGTLKQGECFMFPSGDTVLMKIMPMPVKGYDSSSVHPMNAVYLANGDVCRVDLNEDVIPLQAEVYATMSY